MVSLLTYCVASVLAAVAVIYHAFSSYPQFYDAVNFLADSKLHVLALGNLGFMCVLLFGILMKKIFVGKLTQDEVNDLVQQGKMAIMETGLALAIFRETLDPTTLALFIGLLFTKVFHWLADMRVDQSVRLANIPLTDRLRLHGLLLLLFVSDAITSPILIHAALTSPNPSALVLFAFEWSLLVLGMTTIILKHIILSLEMHQFGGYWSWRATLLFYVEFIAESLHLCLLSAFFGVVCVRYRFPLHLVPDLWHTFNSLRERVRRFVYFRTVASNLNRFPAATEEDLVLGEGTCSVCLEQMQPDGASKKLPCGHCYHTACLLPLLEQTNRCPTCRAQIPAAGELPPEPQQQEAPPEQPPAAGPAAGETDTLPADRRTRSHTQAEAAAVLAQLLRDPATLSATTAATREHHRHHQSIQSPPIVLPAVDADVPRPPLFFQPVLDMGPGSLKIARQHLQAHEQYRDWLQLQLRHAEEMLQHQRQLVDVLALKYEKMAASSDPEAVVNMKRTASSAATGVVEEKEALETDEEKTPLKATEFRPAGEVEQRMEGKETSTPSSNSIARPEDTSCGGESGARAEP